MIQAEIVPALVKVVNDKNIHADIRGGALIALARCGKSMAHVKTFFAVAKPDSGEDKVVQESAILALGILQLKKPEIRDFLINLIDDMDVSFRARCFASISLGLLQDNSDEVFAALEACFGRDADAMGVVKNEPCAERMTFGFTRSVPSDDPMSPAPNASHDRSIAPRLPGFSIASAMRTSEGVLWANDARDMSGVSATAATPSGFWRRDILSKTRFETIVNCTWPASG